MLSVTALRIAQTEVAKLKRENVYAGECPRRSCTVGSKCGGRFKVGGGGRPAAAAPTGASAVPLHPTRALPACHHARSAALNREQRDKAMVEREHALSDLKDANAAKERMGKEVEEAKKGREEAEKRASEAKEALEKVRSGGRAGGERRLARPAAARGGGARVRLRAAHHLACRAQSTPHARAWKSISCWLALAGSGARPTLHPIPARLPCTPPPPLSTTLHRPRRSWKR